MVLLGRVDSIVIKVLELQRVIAHVIHFELVWARCLLDSNLEREFVSARLGGGRRFLQRDNIFDVRVVRIIGSTRHAPEL